MRRRGLILAGVAALAARPALAQAPQNLPRSALGVEAGRQVSFLAREVGGPGAWMLAGSALDARHTPWSSFKIPNLLIALESGIAGDLAAARRWDPARRPAAPYWPAAWRRDQTLGEAFRASTVWYFQDLARQVGTARYRTTLARWGYGNAAVPEGSDRFWLDGTLRISVREQVAFLAALLEGRLGVAPASLAALEEAGLAGVAPGLTLHGKTGAGPRRPGPGAEGWYVGFLRRDAAPPVAFALHTQAPDLAALRDFRRDAALRLLGAAGLLPAGFPQP
ncbi:penicillin-binding transpeptidase domain-containing protein [Roseomonas sp. F4]